MARPRATMVTVLGALAVLYGVLTSWSDLEVILTTHEVTLTLFVLAIAAGELARLRMPSGRETAPLASAAALGIALLGPVDGEPTFDVGGGVVVLVVAVGLGLAAVVRWLRGRAVGLPLVAGSVLGAAVAAELFRAARGDGVSLWDLQLDPALARAVVAVPMVLVSVLGLVSEVVVASVTRAERHGTPWSTALRDEIGEAAPLTLAVVASGPMVALMAPTFGLASLPAALFPLAITYVAVFRFARNRVTYRQTIATLSHLTEEGGYTPVAHAERVAETSVRMGRVLGLSDRVLRDLEYAALLHDLGQLSLGEPIPDGATVLAAPIDQQDIAAEGARIIRHAEGLDTVASFVEVQTTPYRQVREQGQEVPLAGRILKVANAWDDLTQGSDDPARVQAAMERIHLGLGYEYDPDVVEALHRVTADATVGLVGEQAPAGR
jgi:hypothetical protein